MNATRRGGAAPMTIDARLATPTGAGQALRRARAQQRASALEALYRRIAETRMAGVALCHPGLQVAALGFEPVDDGSAAVGVLLTPWFMNLVWLPLADALEGDPPLAVGRTRPRTVGNHGFDFIGCAEEGFGPYEACSLFSPMHEFADQAAARATAEAVLALLRTPAETPAAAPEQAPAPTTGPGTAPPPVPSRRGFLLGRSAG